MKALSLLQPWATLIAQGLKRFETRSWKTDHRGPLLIVSSKRFAPELKLMAMQPPFSPALPAPPEATTPTEAADWLAQTYPCGVILAQATLKECWPTSTMPPLTDQERAFGDFGVARFAWELHDIRPLPSPIPFRGCLGVYEVPDAVLPEAFRRKEAA